MGDSEHMLASAADHLETRQLTSITCHISISAMRVFFHQTAFFFVLAVVRLSAVESHT